MDDSSLTLGLKVDLMADGAREVEVLRWYAMAALPALLTNPRWYSKEEAVRQAWSVAEAMLSEEKRRCASDAKRDSTSDV